MTMDSGGRGDINKEESSILSATLLESARALLTSDGRSWEVTSEEVGASPLEGMMVASIGLSGSSGIKGSLVLIGQPAFFSTVYPPELATGKLSMDNLADWASELANQLLGRIKNRLSTRGLDFSLSIPTVVQGDLLRSQQPLRPNSLGHTVRVDGQRLDVILEIECPDKQLFSNQGPAVPASSEGDGFLF